jgi:hypothetical protein
MIGDEGITGRRRVGHDMCATKAELRGECECVKCEILRYERLMRRLQSGFAEKARYKLGDGMKSLDGRR